MGASRWWWLGVLVKREGLKGTRNIDRHADIRSLECTKGEIEMSTATSVETAGRTSLGWIVAVLGTGLMIAALIVGLLLQRGSDDAVPSRAEVRDATVSRHLEKNESGSFEATADWEIRHLRRPAAAPSGAAHGGELDASVDDGIRHLEQVVRPFDYEIGDDVEIARAEGALRAETARLESAADFYRSLDQRR
jgi:hypothetical protein